MKTNLNAAFNLAFVALLATILGCKKEILIPSNESRGIQNTLHPSIASAESESLLTTLDEWEKTKLDVKKDTANNIIIYNQRPGYGLSRSSIQYLIIDENEKEFKFTPQRVFERKTETGLRGKIRIYRGGTQIFSNQPIDSAESESVLLTTLADLGTRLEIKRDATNNIIIYNQTLGFGLSWNDNQYMIIDENGKEFKFTSRTVFGRKTKTGLRGFIRILKDGTLIFSNESVVIFTMKGASPSAVLDIMVHPKRKVVISNRNPGYSLNEPYGNSKAKYSIVEEDGNFFKFTSETIFPAKTIINLFRDKLQIIKDDEVLFDNLPKPNPLFTIQECDYEETCDYKANSHIKTAILDIRTTTRGYIVVDNRNPGSKLRSLGPIDQPNDQYSIQVEEDRMEKRKIHFSSGTVFLARLLTNFKGRIRIRKNDKIIFSQF